MIPSPAESHDSPWYRKAFGEGYLDLYAHRDDADAARAVNLLRRTLNLRRGVRLLDLCCGPGRHLAHLAPLLGWAVGLDLSRELLSEAGDACREAIGESSGGEIHRFGLIEGDMRHLCFASGTFDFVINLFTSFGYFEDEWENELVIRQVARVLKPGGAFVLDHINRSHLEALPMPDSEKLLRHGIRVIENRSFDPSVSRVVKRVRWQEPDAPSTHWIESVRVYARDEIESILARAGLRVTECFGDYDGAPLSDIYPRMILIAEKT